MAVYKQKHVSHDTTYPIIIRKAASGGAHARKTVVVQKTKARFIYFFEKWLKNCEFVKKRSIMCFSTV